MGILENFGFEKRSKEWGCGGFTLLKPLLITSIASSKCHWNAYEVRFFDVKGYSPPLHERIDERQAKTF